jgi:membrane-associated protease RseP (regulator of RpoE activity)
MNFDHIAFIVFIALITLFLISKRKKVAVQKLLFPLFYFVIYRTNIGIKWMDNVSKKHRNLVQLLGYSCVGFGFVGMIFISITILASMIKFFLAPATTDVGMVLVLPGTTIPGIGYLSFFYFIISILILAVVHEFAHGVVARAHDLEIKSSGFAFLAAIVPIIPAAFVEPDEKKLMKREPVVQYSILSAGPISNVVLALIFLVLMGFVMTPIENRITEPTGFSFGVSPGLPADIAGIESNVLIDSFEGVPVEDSSLFLEKVRYYTSPNETIILGSKGINYSVITIEHPEDNSRGFLGVTNIRNEGKVKEKYSKFGGVFFWIQGLFWWLYLLNVSIGLINLLPVYITDGAKMLYTAIHGSIKNEKKALKIWNFVNLLFVMLIIVGLFATYLKKFGLF